MVFPVQASVARRHAMPARFGADHRGRDRDEWLRRNGYLGLAERNAMPVPPPGYGEDGGNKPQMSNTRFFAILGIVTLVAGMFLHQYQANNPGRSPFGVREQERSRPYRPPAWEAMPSERRQPAWDVQPWDRKPPAFQPPPAWMPPGGFNPDGIVVPNQPLPPDLRQTKPFEWPPAPAVRPQRETKPN